MRDKASWNRIDRKREGKQSGRKCKGAVALILSGMLMLSGCGAEGSASESVVITSESSTESDASATDASNTEGTASGMDTSSSDATLISAVDTGDMFTDRDKEVGYDENSDTMISLNGNSASSTSSAVQIEGSTVTITEEGTYILSGTLTNGSIMVDAETTDKIQIVLMGVSVTNQSSAALYVKQADKVFVTLAAGTDNEMSVTGEFVAIDDNNIDAVIFSKDDLTLNGSGTLTINCQTGHGIVSKDDLVVTGGSYVINASGHGLSGKDSVRIADGTFTLTVGEDAIHGDNDEDETKGFVYVAGGSFTIDAGDDAMHASSAMTIDGGTINIVKSYEGIEGRTVDINGGYITLVSSDDGINAAGGRDQSGMIGDWFSSSGDVYIRISGGSIYVNAEGDGIDSNGALYVSGGETYVSGSTNSSNGSLDYDSEAQITGGIFVAAGASGMAQNFSSTSTQGSMLVTFGNSQAAGTTVKAADAAGNVLAEFTTDKAYNCVVISCPEIAIGSTYTVTAGNETATVEMTEIIYGSGSGMGMGGHGGMGGRVNGTDGSTDGSVNGFGGGQKPEGFTGGQRPEGYERTDGITKTY